MADSPSALPAYSRLPEPHLLFGGAKTDTHPLRGLLNYGPYGSMLGFPSRVRMAYLAPSQELAKLDGIVAELKANANPVEAKNYYPLYPGFQTVFRVPLVDPTPGLRFETPPECNASVAA